jgi:RNA recognition motif-containing protein
MPSLYVAAEGIGETIEEDDLRDAFGKFGGIQKIWVARKPPGFAFVDFDDTRDAEDAVAEMNEK